MGLQIKNTNYRSNFVIDHIWKEDEPSQVNPEESPVQGGRLLRRTPAPAVQSSSRRWGRRADPSGATSAGTRAARRGWAARPSGSWRSSSPGPTAGPEEDDPSHSWGRRNLERRMMTERMMRQNQVNKGEVTFKVTEFFLNTYLDKVIKFPPVLYTSFIRFWRALLVPPPRYPEARPPGKHGKVLCVSAHPCVSLDKHTAHRRKWTPYLQKHDVICV